MVTTGAAEIGISTGVTATGQRADTGSDDSTFSQALGEAAAASAPVAPGTAGKAGDRKSASANVESDTAQPAQLSADILALCGLPVTTTTPTSTPTISTDEHTAATSKDALDITVDPSVQALTAGINPSVPMAPPQTAATQANAVGAPASKDVVSGGAASGTVRAADLQWLNGGMRSDTVQAAGRSKDEASAEVAMDANAGTTQLNPQIAQGDAQRAGTQLSSQDAWQAARQSMQQPAQQSAQQVVQQAVGQTNRQPDKRLETQAIGGNGGAIELPVLPDTTVANPEQQPAFQKLLADVAPMMNMMSAQRREIGADESSREVAASDAQNVGALGAASLQPAGTQLAGDTPVIDIAPRHHLHAQVGTQQWTTELGNKLTMMATKDTQSATLYMTPADLGPVQVRIELNQDQASVWFTAEHAETRSALEQSLPRLREMFTAQGMALTDAGVFGDRSRQQQPDNSFTSTRFVSSQYEDSEALADTATVRSISLSLLDAYA